MNLNVLFTGQSNAAFYAITDGEKLAAMVASLLGFAPGSGSSVSCIGGSQVVSGPAGGQYRNLTTVPSIALQQPLTPGAQGFLTGGPGSYKLSAQGQAVVSYLQSLPAAVRSSPTVIVWMHNESDSTFPDLAASTWTSAVQYYAGQLRTAGLGQSAATTPIVFVNVPFHSDLPALFASSQAIRDGMERLIGTPSFNAVQGPQTAMFDMSGSLGGPLDPNQAAPGGPHMSATDKAVLDRSLASVIAQQLSAYALPGSAAANDAGQPLAPAGWIAATVAGQPDRVVVYVRGARGGIAALGSGAAAGLGWSIVGASGQNQASSAQVLGSFDNGDAYLMLTFQSPVAAGQQLYYGYADSRLSAGPTGTAEGNQVEDSQGNALLLPDDGLTLGQTSDALPATVAAFETTLSDASVVISGGTVTVDGQPVAAGVNTLQFADGQVGLAGSRASLVDRIYQAVLGRHAGLGELLDALRSGNPLPDLAAGMLSSAEYARAHGALSDTDFVNQIYQGSVGCAPTSSDMQACLSLLRTGTSRASLAVSVASSPESQALQNALGYAVRLPDQPSTASVPQQSEIARLYVGLLGRVPSEQEVQAWSGEFVGDHGIDQVAEGFLSSTEFQQGHADAAYVRSLYQGFLGRDADSGGLTAGVSAMEAGASPAQITVAVDYSAEAQADAAPFTVGEGQEQAFVTRLYLGLLGRDPTGSEVDHWTGAIRAGFSDATVAQIFLSSAEYQAIDNAHFVTSLYNGFLGRDPDQGGLATFTGLLDGGASRAHVVALIDETAEARAYWASQVFQLSMSAASAFYVPEPAGAAEHPFLPGGVSQPGLA